MNRIHLNDPAFGLHSDKILGSEFVKPVRMLFCELCKKFLPRPTPTKPEDDLLTEHCKRTDHIDLYKARSADGPEVTMQDRNSHCE